LVLSIKRLVAAAKCLVAATKILFVVPNFVAVTKHFFSVKPVVAFFSVIVTIPPINKLHQTQDN